MLTDDYIRDFAGRIIRIEGQALTESWAYAYDDLDRLATVDNYGDGKSVTATEFLLPR